MRKRDMRAATVRQCNAALKQGCDIRRIVVMLALSLVLSACGGGGGGGGGGTAPRPANQAGQVTVSGNAVQNQVLTATVSDGNGTQGAISYQWLANGQAIAGATGASLQLAQAHVGKSISVRATYVDGASYAESVTSAATAPVADVEDPTEIILQGSGVMAFDMGGNATAYGMAAYPGDRVLVTGNASSATTGVNFAALRYTADGTLDAAFGTQGKATVDFSGSSDVSYAHPLVLSDGKILMGGGAAPSPTAGRDFALARLNADGSLDASFGVGGKATADFLGGSDWINAIALTPEGKIVAAGGTLLTDNTIRFALARFMPTGALDNSFGDGGLIRVALQVGSQTGNSYANDLRILPNGRMLLSGIVAGHYTVARLMPDGSLDTTFGNGGIIATDLSTGLDEANRMAVLGDGSIVVAGTYDGQKGIVLLKYLPNGQLDPAFNRTISAVSGRVDWLYDVAVQPDGKIVAVGTAYGGIGSGRGDLLLTRFLPNGSIDPDFANGGRWRADYSGHSDYGYALKIEANGAITVSGVIVDTGRYAGDFGVWRFDASGKPDRTFGIARALWSENAAPVPLAPNATIRDLDHQSLASPANYNGHVLVLQREGAATGEDVFTGSGAVTLQAGAVTVSGTTVANYTLSGGVLRITFGTAASQQAVNQVVSGLAYRNQNSMTGGGINIEWRWVDPAGVNTTARSIVVVGNDLLDVGDMAVEVGSPRPTLVSRYFLAPGYAYMTSSISSQSVLAWNLNLTNLSDINRTNVNIWSSYTPGLVVKVMTSAEAVALAQNPNRPAAYRSGKFWTATQGGFNQHVAIDMATGRLTAESDDNRYRALMLL